MNGFFIRNLLAFFSIHFVVVFFLSSICEKTTKRKEGKEFAFLAIQKITIIIFIIMVFLMLIQYINMVLNERKEEENEETRETKEEEENEETRESFTFFISVYVCVFLYFSWIGQTKPNIHILYIWLITWLDSWF